MARLGAILTKNIGPAPKGKYRHWDTFRQAADPSLGVKVLLVAIVELHNYLARKAREIQEAEDLVRKALAMHGDLNLRQLALVNHALKTPNAQYTVQSHQKSHNISYETARTDLVGLSIEGLLQQRKLRRAFIFTPIPNLRAMLEGKPAVALVA